MTSGINALNVFENYRHSDNFGNLLGYEVTHFDREKREAEVVLKVTERHLSMAKKVHGGVISALLDFACGAAVVTTLDAKDLCSTVEIKVNYFHPVHVNETLTAKAAVVFRGKKLCATTAHLYSTQDSDPVAMASATYNVVSASKKKS